MNSYNRIFAPRSRRDAIKLAGAAAAAAIGLPMLNGADPPAAEADCNGFPFGQCTYWAAKRYRDLTGICVPWNGDAWRWAYNARDQYGWYISKTPRVGAIMVLQPNQQGAGSAGHVGIVEYIADSYWFQVSNMNWAGSGSTETRTRFHTSSYDVDFIYGPQAAQWLNGSVGSKALTGYSFWAKSGQTYVCRLRPTSADADLYFYRYDSVMQRWVMLAYSVNGGTSEDVVTWTASFNTQVCPYVYGYGGATNYSILLPLDVPRLYVPVSSEPTPTSGPANGRPGNQKGPHPMPKSPPPRPGQ